MGSDGRRKFTIEEAFQVKSDGDIAEVNPGREPPWGIGWQTAERNLAWNDELKERLIKRVAADQLNLSGEELDSNLASLQQLLPNLSQKLRVMKPELIAKLAVNPDALAVKLVQLKQIFPQADTAKMVCSDLSLVLSADLDSVAASAQELRDMLPNVNVDKLVEDNAAVLNVSSFKKTIEHARQVMGPDLDIIDTLQRRPAMLFQFQQGNDLIPYDEVPNQSGKP